MRTETISIYTFEELNEDVQQKVIQKYYDINLDYRWWEDSYEMFKELAKMSNIRHLEILGFDLDRGNYLELKGFISFLDLKEFAKNPIKENGYRLLEDLQAYAKKILKGKKFCPTTYKEINNTDCFARFSGKYSIETDFGVLDSSSTVVDMQVRRATGICEDFLQHFKHVCLRSLKGEFEYLESDEAIRETIIANEFEFLADGSRC